MWIFRRFYFSKVVNFDCNYIELESCDQALDSIIWNLKPSAGEGETISPMSRCQCPEMIFNMSQGYKFWRFKNHQIFQIIEDIVWGSVYCLIVNYLVMVPDFEKHKSWLMLNVISGHSQRGIGEIVSPPPAEGFKFHMILSNAWSHDSSSI